MEIGQISGVHHRLQAMKEWFHTGSSEPGILDLLRYLKQVGKPRKNLYLKLLDVVLTCTHFNLPTSWKVLQAGFQTKRSLFKILNTCGNTYIKFLQSSVQNVVFILIILCQ